MSRTLSKSDFKIARTCATKLYYKELGYPSTMDDNPYLGMLADGGYMVELIAKLLYPEGIDCSAGGGTDASVAATAEAMRADRVTIFEGTFVTAGGWLARVDILRKDGDTLELIEVKSKSFSSAAAAESAHGPFRTTKGAIASGWVSYLEDVTFQVAVLRDVFPSATIRPSLALVDKDRTASEDLVHQHFRIERIPRPGGTRADVRVTFDGDVDRLRADHIVAIVDVSREVDELTAEVRREAARFAASLAPELERLAAPLSVGCKDCEYRGASRDGTRDGFGECWGVHATADPHLFDLYFVTEIGPKTDRMADRMIGAGRCSLLDVDPATLVTADGTTGKRNERQLIQLEHTKRGTPWFSPMLAARVRTAEYPLHFIDFETSALAVPYHAGMHPYETVAFQWSCHTVATPDGPLEHAEWINTKEPFPNVEFARTLRDRIGTGGSVMMWAPHEQTVLRGIRGQMTRYGLGDPALDAWLLDLAGIKDTQPGRLIDMNRMTIDGFFHPVMGGRTSIKCVLPAVWGSDPELPREFPEYRLADGRVPDNPYDALPPAVIAGSSVECAEGTGAMRAYQEMLYGASRTDPVAREQYKALLLRYCRLDTAAMVMIWNYWRRLAAG